MKTNFCRWSAIRWHEALQMVLDGEIVDAKNADRIVEISGFAKCRQDLKDLFSLRGNL